MKKVNIAIIGGGKMGSSIATGLLSSGFSATQITVADKSAKTLTALKKVKIKTLSNNSNAIKGKDLVIIAVKPNHNKAVLNEIAKGLTEKQILISIVTGASLDDIQSTIDKKIATYRVMPNTAISIKESMICIAKANSNKTQDKLIIDIFDKLGKAIYIEEDLMAAATVLGASGTAFAMRFMRAVIEGGVEIGFEADVAQTIFAQTVKGAASLLLENETNPEVEIDRVTTPNGCTIAGLNSMENEGLSGAVIKGINSSYRKIAKIADEF